MDIQVISSQELLFNNKRYRCAIGKNGASAFKKEGDGCTPKGTFVLRECRFRADRISAPKTFLPLHVTKAEDGWCDAPEHPSYNTPVTLPFAASYERLWREDNVYDIIVPLGYNDAPVIRGEGSAIFFHLATPGYTPTEGCVAVNLADMLEVLQSATTHTTLTVRDF